MPPDKITTVSILNKNAYKDLIGKSEGERSLEMSRRRWEDTTKMHVKKSVLKLSCSESGSIASCCKSANKVSCYEGVLISP